MRKSMACTAAAISVIALLAAVPVRAAVTNVVDVAALVAAVDAGLSETNGWTLSGLGKYAAGTAGAGSPACVKFDTIGDSLASPDFGATIIGLEIGVRCSATNNATRLLHVRGMDDVEKGVVATCDKGDKYEVKSLLFGDNADFSQFKIVLEGTKTTGNWGIGALSVITAEPAVAPSNLRVSRKGDDWCALSWENDAGTVSNRVDAFLVGRGAGEDVLLSTGFDGFDAIGKGNPVPSSEKLPEIDPLLSGVNIYAPTNTSGICQVGKGDALGIIRWEGVGGFAGVSLRMSAKRHPGDNAETIVAYEAGGSTNAIATLVLAEEFAEYSVDLSKDADGNAVPGGVAILIGYYTKKSNRRVLIDGMSIVRTGVDEKTLVDSRWIPSSPGAAAFSTEGVFALPPKADCIFEVRAVNADGLLSDAATVETRLGGVSGFRFVLR